MYKSLPHHHHTTATTTATMNVTPLLLILFLVSTCHGERQNDSPAPGILSTTNTQKKLEMSKEVSCPDPTDIEPCKCVSHGSLTMDCSKVEDEEQLRKVFSAVFPTTDFQTFIMWDNTGLKVLEDGVFGNVSFVEISIAVSYLEIGCALETVQNDALTPSLSTLTDLSIIGCELTTFPFERLQEFTSLEYVDLSYMKIQSLPPLSSSSIIRFGLNYNPISHLSADVFTGLTAVGAINLYGCNLTEITPGTFSSIPKLRGLILAKNNISYLQSLAFDFISPTVDTLDLGNNSISTVEVDAIKGVSAPADILLDNNELATLEEEVWTPLLEENVHLYLTGNPLTCDCDIAWLVRNQDLVNNAYGRCPDGTLLWNLDPADFDHCG